MSSAPGASASGGTPPRVLSIAGSDSGGGAGIQADLKTFCAHGVYGMTVVTAVTAQNTHSVDAVHSVPPEVVSAQIEAVLADIGADAIKIGMLANAPVVQAVARSLTRHRAALDGGCPVVLDPVMIAKSGAALLRDDAVSALVDELLPLATVVTPNLPEAEVLAEGLAQDFGGGEAATPEARLALARRLAELGPAVLLKGGHAAGDTVVDVLSFGGVEKTFSHPRVRTRSTHGTGCTLSSALAARLALGDDLSEAASGAIRYLQGALGAAFPLGAGDGHGPVNHLFELGVERRIDTEPGHD